MQKKQKNKKNKKQRPKKTPILWGGLENGQEVVPPFFPKMFSQNPQKALFYSVSRKMGGNHFFKKTMLQEGQI